MAEVPSSRSIFDVHEEDIGLRLHSSTQLSKSVQESDILDNSDQNKDIDLSFGQKEADTSNISLSSSGGRDVRYSADNEFSSEEDENQQELSVELGQFVGTSFQRSPYNLRSGLKIASSQSNSSSEPDTSLEKYLDKGDTRDVKPRRDSLTPNEILVLAPGKHQIFPKSFKPVSCFPSFVLPTVEECEEERTIGTTEKRNIKTLNKESDEQGDRKCSGEESYVLNINFHIPKEFGTQDIPLNVNIINDYNPQNCSLRQRRSLGESANSSINESSDDPKNSTMISERDQSEPTSTVKPDERIANEINFEAQMPSPIHESLDTTLIVSDKYVQETLDNLKFPQPGPSGMQNLKDDNLNKTGEDAKTEESNKKKVIKNPVPKKKAVTKNKFAKKVVPKPKKEVKSRTATVKEHSQGRKPCKYCCCSNQNEKKDEKKKTANRKGQKKPLKKNGKTVKAACRNKPQHDSSSSSESDCSVCNGRFCGYGKSDNDSSDVHLCSYCCTTTSSSSDTSSSDYDSSY